MAVKIRLARAGAKKRPYYHIVIANSTSPRDGKFIEIVGAYNPMLGKSDEKRVKLDSEKIAAHAKQFGREQFFQKMGSHIDGLLRKRASIH